MKLGIRTISYIPVEGCADFGQLPPGTKFDLSSFLSSPPSVLPFTPATVDLTEQWSYDAGGRRSDISLAADIRANREEYRPVLQQLTGRRHLFLVETIDGQKYIIGSPSFPATFTWSDSVSGISRLAFGIRIECRSLHGALFSV